MYQISTWSTKYCKRTTEKVWWSKYKKKLVCRVSSFDTRQTCSLPSASCQALGKVFPFVECPWGHSAKSVPIFFKKFAECLSAWHSKKWYFFLKNDAPIWHSANRPPLPSARSGHSANGPSNSPP